MAALRTFTGGRLRGDSSAGVPVNGGGLPMQSGGRSTPPTQQRLTGDERGNANPGLLAVTALWLLEHNRQCAALAAAHPSWGDAQLFNAARRRVIALFQHVTVNEALPALLGTPLPAYTGYDPGADPSPTVEFAASAATAAGVLASPGSWMPLTPAGTPHSIGPLLERDVAFDPVFLDACSAGDVLRGAVYQLLGAGGFNLSPDVQHHFEGERNDAAAQALMRARDLGVPSYTRVRQALGLAGPSSVNGISSDPRVQAALQAVYGSDVSKVDLLVGGLAEAGAAQGAHLGPTLAAVVREQFIRVRGGDRFWYEHSDLKDATGTPYLSSAERSDVLSTSYADILKRNIGSAGVPGDVFRAPVPGRLDAEVNVVLPSPPPVPGAPASPAPMPTGNTTAPGTDGASNVRSVTAGPITMQWVPPGANDTDLVMTVTLAGTGWFAWGLGEGMADGDILLLRTTAAGQGQVLDTRSTGYVLPFTDAQQDAQLVAASEVGGRSSVTFRRALNTGDSADKAIQRGDTQVPIMLAWDESSDSFGFHGPNRILGRLDLFTPADQVQGGGGFEDLSDDRSAYITAYLYHGISMFLTWGLLVPSAVFTVRFAKHYPFWMSYHRWAMVGASTVTVPSASAALIAQATGTIQGRTHALMGIVLVVIMQVQLFVGLLVRHWMKGAAEPPMRAYIVMRFGHRLAGWGVLLLGLGQAYMGVVLLSPDLRGAYLGLVITICVVFLVALGYNEFLVTSGAVDSGKLLSAVQSSTISMSVSEVRRRLREGVQWVFMDGVVYDVGTFMRQHPGGAYFLGRMVGADIGSMFRGHNRPDERVKPHKHSARAHKLLAKLAVGVLRKDTDVHQSWVESSDRGLDRWTLQDTRQVSFGADPVFRLVFRAPRSNAIPADQWSLTGMALHMMVAIPGPTEAEGGPMEWLLQRTKLRRPAHAQRELWHGAARSYSIVREDAGAGLVMYVKAYRMGLVSPHLCRLRVGDPVQMEGPQGLGMLDHDATGVVVAVCQGTCIATVFDLITHIVARHRVLRAAQAAARRQAARSQELLRQGTIGSEGMNASFRMGGEGGIAFNLQQSFGLGATNTLESPKRAPHQPQQLHAGGGVHGELVASPMPSMGEDTLTWVPSVSEVGTGTQAGDTSMSVDNHTYSVSQSRSSAMGPAVYLDDAPPSGSTDGRIKLYEEGGHNATDGRRTPASAQMPRSGGSSARRRESSVDPDMRPIALPSDSEPGLGMGGVPRPAPLTMIKQGTIEHPVLIDDAEDEAPSPVASSYHHGLHVPPAGDGGSGQGPQSSNGSSGSPQRGGSPRAAGRRRSAHDGVSGGIAVLTEADIAGGGDAKHVGGVHTRRRSESAPKPIRSVLRSRSRSPSIERGAVGGPGADGGSAHSGASGEGGGEEGGEGGLSPQDALARIRSRRSVSFSDSELGGPDTSAAVAAAAGAAARATSPLAPSDTRRSGSGSGGGSGGSGMHQRAYIGRESTAESIRELRTSSDVDATLVPGGWDAQRKGAPRPQLGGGHASSDKTSKRVPGLPKRPKRPMRRGASNSSSSSPMHAGKSGIFSRLVGRGRVAAQSKPPLPIQEEPPSDEEEHDVFSQSGTLDIGGGDEVPSTSDLLYAADAVVWPSGHAPGGSSASGSFHGSATGSDEAHAPLHGPHSAPSSTSGGSSSLPSGGSGRRGGSPTPLVRRPVVRQDSASQPSAEATSSSEQRSSYSSEKATVVSSTAQRRGSVVLSEHSSSLSSPSARGTAPAVRGNTLSSVETATDSYQKAREAEQQAARLNKPLRLVLLGVFRDAADVFELEWLLRMQAECPNIAVRFLIKNEPRPSARPTEGTAGAAPTAPSGGGGGGGQPDAARTAALLRDVRLKGKLSHRVLRRLLPQSDLHSVVVCGSHGFKSSVTAMYRKVGVPLSSITTL